MNTTHPAVALVVDRWPRPTSRLAAVGRSTGGAGGAGRPGDCDRATSSVIGIVVLVAMVLIVAATVGWAGLGFSEQLREPAPNVAESNAKFVADSGITGQIVRLTHVAGDSIAVSNIEILVDAECDDGDAQGRVVALPPDGNSLDAENIEGTDFFDESSFRSDRTVLRSDTTNTLSAGEFIQFRMISGTCEVPAGNKVTVRIIHMPSDSVVIKEMLTAS
ncbi:type IV pilin N-terminal domain-containing protein [Halohasta salina]|uniref:type IV pilin N-terminal domain-containing protein n=1 Tax=Halohasta salina TaxID=2961621 RepID=UPI0020A470E9|nr:type IV pilin [Halohasta salina]